MTVLTELRAALDPRRSAFPPYTDRLANAARSPIAAGISGKAAELVTQVLLVTIVPRVLGPSSYGEFAVALSIVTIVSFPALGGAAVIARFVPAAEPSERSAIARAFVARFARWRLVQVALALLAGLVLIVVDPQTFPPLVTGLVVGALGLNIAATLASNVALALGRERIWSFRFPLQNAVTIIAACALGALAGTDGAVAGIVIGAAGALVWTAPAALSQLRGAAPGSELPGGAMRYGALQSLSNLLSLTVNRGGIVMVAILASSSVEAGYASIALGVVLTVSGTLAQAFTVQLPSMIARASGDGAAAEASAVRVATVAQLLLVPAAVVGALTVGPLLTLAVGDEFRGAESALGPALAVLPLLPMFALGNQLAALRLRPGERLSATVAGTLVFFAVTAVTVPAWGAAGASTALLAATATRIASAARAFPEVLTARRLVASMAGAALALCLAIVL